MPKLILHVGTGKTGTTSIQVALRRNEEALAGLGYHVMQGRRMFPQSAKHKLNWKNAADKGWAELSAEAERVRPTGRHLVMSNESLWRVDPYVMLHLASMFPGYEPMVVMYVREQVEWIQSSLLQKLKKPQKKTRQAMDLDNKEKVDRWIRRRPLDYHAVCEGMEAAFGAGTVHARSFNRNVFVEGDLIIDFFHAIGVPDPHVLNLEQSEANPSMAAQFSGILMRSRQEDSDNKVGYKQMQDLACRLTANGVGSRYFMTRERVEELRSKWRPSNKLFAQKYLKNAPSIAEKDAWIPDNVESEAEIVAKMEDITDRLLMISPKGWVGQVRGAGKVFAEGWKVEEATPGGASTPSVRARMVAPAATIRFRLPYRRRYLHKQGVVLALRTADDRALTARVTANDLDLGTLTFPGDTIRFPVESCEPLDEVTLLLEAIGDWATLPPVVAIDPLSLKIAGEEDDDDLDDDGEDDEDEG